jgi:glycosyltransferase involved in cell wall biosynthesis
MHIRWQIPVFNEAETVGGVVRAALEASAPFSDTVSVLIIDDGSEDGSQHVVAAMALDDPRISVIRHRRNLGLGVSFQEGLAMARRDRVDWLVHIDADGQFDPGALAQLLEPAVRERLDLVTASRRLSVRPSPPMGWLSRVGNAALSSVVSAVGKQAFTDVCCGFRVYSRRAIEQLRPRNSFTYTHETILSAALLGLRIREIPIPVGGRRAFGQAKISRRPVWYAYQASQSILRTWIQHKKELRCAS